jgi:hypothetical protein
MSSSSIKSSSSSSSLHTKSDKKRKELSLNAKDQTLWLVKVPDFVAEKWASSSSDDILGSLSYSVTQSNQPNMPPSKKINVSLTQTEEEKINNIDVNNFTLEDIVSSGDQMMAFSVNSETDAYGVQGQITKNLLLKPVGTNNYRNLVRDRGVQIRKNTLVVSTADQRNAMSSGAGHIVDFIVPPTQRRYLNKAGTLEGYDSEKLRGKLFEAFNACEQQGFKEIIEFCKDISGFTKDKEKELKEQLEIYAFYWGKGKHRGKWELKSEYKDYTMDSNNQESSSV